MWTRDFSVVGPYSSDDRSPARGGESFEGAYWGWHQFSNKGSSADRGRVEAVLSRNHRKLEPVRGANLVEHAGEMVFDGLLTDAALLRNFSIRTAGDHKVQHLTLTPVSLAVGPLIAVTCGD